MFSKISWCAMAFFKQGVPTEYLILGEAGHIPIETITAWSVSERLDYAWKMDNSHKAQSYVSHKIEAVDFLSESFGLHVNPDHAIVIPQIRDLIALKITVLGQIPTTRDFTPILLVPEAYPAERHPPVEASPRGEPLSEGGGLQRRLYFSHPRLRWFVSQKLF